MEFLQAVQFFLAAVIVLWLPGAAVLAWIPEKPRGEAGTPFDLFAHLADAVALSISMTSIAALGLFLLRISLGPLVVGALYALALLALVWGLLRRPFSLPRGVQGGWLNIVSLLLLGVLVAWRLYQARELALPSWVDSVHHALIVRVIIERGGLPVDLSPYMPVPLVYHYAFHVVAALFSGWSGLPVEMVLLRFGQVINALVVVSVYRLAQYFMVERQPPVSGEPHMPWNQLKPLLAALLVGFVFQMPAYYLTWGRYTLLTGLLLLGPLLVAAVEIYDQPDRFSAWLRYGLLLTGMCLAHYFALVLVAVFLVVLGLVCVVKGLKQPAARKALLHLVFIGLLAVLFASPWLWRILLANQQQTDLQFTSPLETQAEAVKRVADYLAYLLQMIGPRRGHILMGIAALGLIFSLRRATVRFLAVWAFLLALLALPWGIRLGPFRPDHYAIILFFPASIFIADLLVDGTVAFREVIHRTWGSILLAVAVLAVLVWGVKETRNILNSVTVFAVPADLRALDWVTANTPPTARFYNNAVHWQNGVYRGVDGGAWLLPYAARESMVPPVVYVWGTPAYIQQIKSWAERSTQQKGCTPEFKELVREARLNYIYLRQGQGSLQPDMLAGCPGLQVRYQQDGVFIYEILPDFLSTP